MMVAASLRSPKTIERRASVKFLLSPIPATWAFGSLKYRSSTWTSVPRDGAPAMLFGTAPCRGLEERPWFGAPFLFSCCYSFFQFQGA
jgi:hypothetical protein